MKINEIRGLDAEGLQQEVLKCRKELLLLRIKSATGELKQVHLVKVLKRTIARIKTVLAERTK
jgi:large subunit ribosomal protein L29